MGVKIIEIVVALFINMIQFVKMEDILPCNVSSLYPCPGANQICNVNHCDCLDGYVLVGKECEPQSTENDDSSKTTTTVVVVSFTIALVVCGLFLVIRKYKLIDYVRNKINIRRNNDVMYEDVMIGHDDPPLTP